MTTEEKQLLLKDLCARLPYGVILNNGAKARSIDVLTKIVSGIGTDKKIEDTKYYLRPKSSMTEEEKKTLNNILEYQYCSDDSCMCESTDWLNAHHFDYRGLIPMGLALEAPEGMYEIN